MSNLNVPIKAIREKIIFSEELSIDGYKMPDGEYRIGLSSAGLALGYSDRWIDDIVKLRTPRTAKALQGLGFGGKIEKVFAQSNQGNSYQDSTISLDDFNHLIAYGTIKGKQKAIALQTALTKIALTDFFRDSFNDVPLTTQDRRSLFYKTYAESLSYEDWLEMDREDVTDLILPGDTE